MKKREWELDAVRILACFMVVVIHVTGYGMEVKDPAESDWAVRNIAMCIVRSAVPVFFMLSGVLFLRREIPLRTLYRKYIVHLAAVWSIWSAFYAGIDYLASLKAGNGSWSCFLERFAQGHYHLWFLPTLLGTYLLYPFLQNLIQHSTQQQIRYLGILVVIGVVGKHTLAPFFSGDVWNAVWDNLGFPELSSGVVYFVLGYYLYQTYTAFSAKLCFILYTGSVALMSIINQIWACRMKIHVSVTYDYLGLGVFTASSALFLLLLQLLKKRQISDKARAGLFLLSDHTLGIYLVHTLFLEQVYRRLGLTQDGFPALISVICFSVLTFLLSFFTVWCIRRIPVVGKKVV